MIKGTCPNYLITIAAPKFLIIYSQRSSDDSTIKLFRASKSISRACHYIIFCKKMEEQNGYWRFWEPLPLWQQVTAVVVIESFSIWDSTGIKM